MTKNFSDFIDPIAPAQPAGIDIEYDTRFIDIQTIAEGKPEQQFGDVIIEAESPDWGAVEKLCYQILSESKDLRVFCFYTQALTANHGVVGFKKGCEIIYDNISKYWDDLYPKLVDEEDNYDTFYRSGAIGLLLASSGVVQQLNNANILYSPSKKSYLTVKSTVAALLSNDDGLYPGGRERLLEDLKIAYETEQDEILALEDSVSILSKIEDIFAQRIQDVQLDFSIIKKPLALIIASIVKEDKREEDLQPSSLTTTDISASSNAAISHSKSIDNLQDIKIKDRADVKIILEKLNLYFRLKEPSHPAPLFVERLQKLMDMNFYDILKNISPSSLNDLDLIIGKSEDTIDENSDNND